MKKRIISAIAVMAALMSAVPAVYAANTSDVQNTPVTVITENVTQDQEDTFLTAPVLTSVKSVYGGMKITWNKVSGAKKYKVYVKNGSAWKELGITSSLYYTDKSVISGKSYTYTVQCVSADGKNSLSTYSETGISGTYIKAPSVIKIENVSNGSKITWVKVNGAYKYRLFAKSGSSGWKKLTDTTSNTFTQTGLKTGTEYNYTVVALDKNGNIISGYNTQGWSNKYLQAPTITSVQSVYGGLKVTWNKVKGAEKYRVYIKDGSSWKKLADTTSVSYLDKSVSNGKSYTYTVRCITADGKKTTSDRDDNGKSETYVQAPEITKTENIANGTKITWKKVSGAVKYRLYVKVDGSGWKTVGDTTGNTLTHTGLSSGKNYKYTVRVIKSSSGKISGYKSAGWDNLYISPRPVTSVNNTSAGVALSWKSVKGAAGYSVYRKGFSGSWVKLADVKNTSYTDKSAPKNTLYSYTIRCFDKNGKLISYYQDNTKYYYNGVLANGKITSGKNTYNFTDGVLKQGYVTVNGSTYYYNSDGVLQKNGVVGTKKEGYSYADKNGKIDYSFTGIAKNSQGYWYCIKGKVDLTYRNAVTYNNADWLVLDGKATKAVTESDKTLFRAMKIVVKITDSSMTKAEKLKVCFDYVKVAYTELNPRIPHYHGMDWPIVYANDMFIDGAGNCFSYGSAFAFMAKAIGYENVYCCHSGGHGWAEIDGLVYDPEWSRHRFVYSYYGVSYDANIDVNYKAAIAAGYDWMHVKI